MEILRRLLLLPAFLALPALADEVPAHVIAYHDVRDRVVEDYDPDQFAVSTANLVDQFTWLRDNGFHAVSVDQILAARAGGRPLPAKSVLITFDDGLASVYTHLFPLLKMFDYPAVVSVVTSWIESDETIDYAGRNRGRDGFLTWEQMREMQASGLVEIATHTHDMHRGILANPQGNLQPAAKTRAYDGTSYETEADFIRRIGADLAQSIAILEKETGARPRVVTWPYGAYNRVSQSVAAEHGLSVNLTLDLSSAGNERYLSLGRYLASANPGIADFSREFLVEKSHPIVRVAEIDLDDVYDPDPVRQSRNLDLLVDRIKALEISHVFLQAFADDGSGTSARSVYFPNRHLPVRADLFDYVAWQLKTRGSVLVFARLPMLSYAGEAFEPAWRVVRLDDGVAAPDPQAVAQLSPFNRAARERIAEVYEDLAANSHLDGILFHDDGRLADSEDFSDAAIERYQAAFGREITPESLMGDADLLQRAGDLKADAVLEFSAQLIERVRRYHPAAKSARRLYAGAVPDGDATNYAERELDSYLAAYDFVALMTEPSLEDGAEQRRFFEGLVETVRGRAGGLARTIFELRPVAAAGPVPNDELRSIMRWLQAVGVRNLGYYPENFIDGLPDFHEIRLGISLAEDLAGSYR